MSPYSSAAETSRKVQMIVGKHNLDPIPAALLYLSGEMPPEQSAEFKQLMAGDPGLAVEVDRLRVLREGVDEAMAALDGAGGADGSCAAAARRATRALRQWAEARRAPKPVPITTLPARRMPWMRFSFAAAAVLLLGFLVWSVYHPDVAPPLTAEVQSFPSGPAPSRIPIDLDHPTAGGRQIAAMLQESMDSSKSEDDSDASLAAAAIHSDDLELPSTRDEVQ